MNARLVRPIAAIVVIAATAWFLAHADLAGFGSALATARLAPLAVAAVANFAIMLCKAVVWRSLLAPAYDLATPRLFRYTVIAFAASVVLPLRAGELVRLWLLRDRDGVPLARGAAVALAEKLLDVTSMLLMLAPLPFVARQAPASAAWIIGGGALAAVAAIYLARRLGPWLGTVGWRGDLARGLDVVHDLRKLATGVAVLLASWLVDLAMIELVLVAVGANASLEAGLFVLLGANLALAIPSTPAGVGALELGAVFALRAVHVPEGQAVAFAVLYHGLQIIPVLLAGLALGAPEIRAHRDKRE